MTMGLFEDRRQRWVVHRNRVRHSGDEVDQDLCSRVRNDGNLGRLSHVGDLEPGRQAHVLVDHGDVDRSVHHGTMERGDVLVALAGRVVLRRVPIAPPGRRKGRMAPARRDIWLCKGSPDKRNLNESIRGCNMIFDDRIDAGRRLAVAVKARGFEEPVVLGIPRGGVPVAAEVARAIDGQLAVVVARKLGAPGNPELAIGATTATGVAYINHAAAVAVGADKEYIEAERQRQVREAHHREEMFNSHRRPPLQGRNVVVVDDGIATGATAIAAVRSIKAEGAACVVLAVPVGSPHTLEVLRHEADEVICLYEPEDFWAVGQFYRDFQPVHDDEVMGTLDAFEVEVVADPARDVEITREGVRLAGVLRTPVGPGPFALVIFVHGLGSSKESPRNVVIANHLVDAGIATLLFDLSGHGGSSDDPVGGIEAYEADLEATFRWAVGQDEVRNDLIGVAGSSLGATVAAAAVIAGRVQPRTMVLRAPPMQAQEFRRIHVPSLVLIGSLDPLRRSVESDVQDCPELTLSVVEGAGHLFEEPGTLQVALERTVDWFLSMFFAPAIRETGNLAIAIPEKTPRAVTRRRQGGPATEEE